MLWVIFSRKWINSFKIFLPYFDEENDKQENKKKYKKRFFTCNLDHLIYVTRVHFPMWHYDCGSIVNSETLIMRLGWEEKKRYDKRFGLKKLFRFLLIKTFLNFPNSSINANEKYNYFDQMSNKTQVNNKREEVNILGINFIKLL